MPIVALVMSYALAQDASGAGVPAPTVAPAAPALPVEPLSIRSAWKGPEAPSDAGPLSSISVGADGVWAVGDIYGGVYTSDDVGLHWHVGIGARLSPHMDTPGEEERILEAESEIEDATSADQQDIDELDADPESAEDIEDIDLPSDGPDGNSVDVAISLAEAEGRRDAGAEEAAWVWMHPYEAGLGFASRSDGLWRSRDSGVTWERIGDESSLTGALVMGNAVIFAGPTGIVYTADQGDTRLGIDIGGGSVVHQLALEEGILYAATDNGLFSTSDGMSWWGTNLIIPVNGVAGDPAWTGGLWVATHDGVLRSDDAGATFRPTGRQPVLGMRGLRGMADAGHVLAWGTDGVWESMDNGVTWAPVVRGLRDPDVRALDLIDGWPLIATPTGAWALRPWSPPTAAGPEAWVDVSSLVAASVDRAGLSANLLGYARGQVAARFLPKLTLTAAARSWERRDSDYFLFETTENRQFEWGVRAEVCFGGCISSVSVDVDEAYEAYNDGESLSDAYGIDDAGSDGGTMMATDTVIDSENEPVLAAMNTARSIQSYRLRLADTVTEAEMSRRTLLAQSASIATQSVAAQVEHALKLQEAEARLDLYTNGVYTQLAAQRATESP